MKVTGFTFIRNAIKLDYPIVEAIQSILPICDEVVVAVGNSEDETLALVKGLGDKIRIIETVWDDNLREGGKVLAEETNKVKAAISADTDWCVYIQGDEVMHEDYHANVVAAMKKYQNESKVDGLLFKYHHFYGSYDYIGDAIQWYPKEIRVVKNNPEIYSYRDAQGFRKGHNHKLNVVEVDAYIHHYGWVKDPKAVQAKMESFNKLWHDDEWMNENIYQAHQFDYSDIGALWKFQGSHPKVMHKRIQEKGWVFDHDISKNQFSLKQRLKKWVQKITGLPLGEYRNYKIIN